MQPPEISRDHPRSPEITRDRPRSPRQVLLAVHVAEIEFAKPQPPPPPDVRVSLHLLVTTLQRGIDGALQPAGGAETLPRLFLDTSGKRRRGTP